MWGLYGNEAAFYGGATFYGSSLDTRRALVFWTEGEFPDAARRAVVYWIEGEIPLEGRRAVFYWTEGELEDPTRAARFYWTEGEIAEAVLAIGAFGLLPGNRLTVDLLQQEVGVICQDERTFEIVRGDTVPGLLLRLAAAGQIPPGFATATGTLELVSRAGVIVLSGVGTLYDVLQEDALGQLYDFAYAWQVGDTDLDPAVYKARVRVDFGGGQITTFPTDPRDRIRVKITEG